MSSWIVVLSNTRHLDTNEARRGEVEKAWWTYATVNDSSELSAKLSELTDTVCSAVIILVDHEDGWEDIVEVALDKWVPEENVHPVAVTESNRWEIAYFIRYWRADMSNIAEAGHLVRELVEDESDS